jgi:hypothetical protein
VTVLEAPKRVVNSTRFKKLLPWVSALVLLAGIGTFLGVRYSNTAKVTNPNPTGAVIPAEVPQKNIPFPAAAWRVAREWAFTALPRKNLDRSFALTHPSFRSGYTLKQWETGTLPNIPFYPIGQILKYNWKNTNFAHPREAQINVIMVSMKSSNQRPVPAQIGLRKVGSGAQAHWMVDYFSPVSGPRIPPP